MQNNQSVHISYCLQENIMKLEFPIYIDLTFDGDSLLAGCDSYIIYFKFRINSDIFHKKKLYVFKKTC